MALRCLVGLALAVSLGGCADYVKRRDTITLSAGEAQAWNQTVHVTDPWPPHAGNTRIDGDGQRVARIMERYSIGAGAAPPAQEDVSANGGTNGPQPTAERSE